jgi:hypothetical protein
MSNFRSRWGLALAGFVSACAWFGRLAYESLIHVGYFMALMPPDIEAFRREADRLRPPPAPDDRPLTAQEQQAWAELAVRLVEAPDRKPRGKAD